MAVMRISHSKERAITNLLEDALVTGLYLNAFICYARSVRLANFTTMMTAVGLNYPNMERLDRPVPLNTVYYPFELYSRTCRQLALDVFWSAKRSPATGRSYTGIRTLGCHRHAG